MMADGVRKTSISEPFFYNMFQSEAYIRMFTYRLGFKLQFVHLKKRQVLANGAASLIVKF